MVGNGRREKKCKIVPRVGIREERRSRRKISGGCCGECVSARLVEADSGRPIREATGWTFLVAAVASFNGGHLGEHFTSASEAGQLA